MCQSQRLAGQLRSHRHCLSRKRTDKSARGRGARAACFSPNDSGGYVYHGPVYRPGKGQGPGWKRTRLFRWSAGILLLALDILSGWIPVPGVGQRTTFSFPIRMDFLVDGMLLWAVGQMGGKKELREYVYDGFVKKIPGRTAVRAAGRAVTLAGEAFFCSERRLAEPFCFWRCFCHPGGGPYSGGALAPDGGRDSLGKRESSPPSAYVNFSPYATLLDGVLAAFDRKSCSLVQPMSSLPGEKQILKAAAQPDSSIKIRGSHFVSLRRRTQISGKGSGDIGLSVLPASSVACRPWGTGKEAGNGLITGRNDAFPGVRKKGLLSAGNAFLQSGKYSWQPAGNSSSRWKTNLFF